MAAPIKPKHVYTVLVIATIFTQANGFLEGLYCGQENCYDVIGVTRDATKQEITKAYRQLAKKLHPDMHKSAADKEIYGEKFQALGNAYEILKDEEQRKDYDYMLDNPELVYRHYYRYYRRRVAPKVDVRVVIAVTITIISAIQYLSAWNKYNAAINYLVTVPKYRIRASEIAKEEGLFDQLKKQKRRPKEEVKQEEEAIIKRVVEGNMDIKGGYARPSIYDVLWMKIILLPYAIGKYIIWWLNWVWRFTVKQEPYDIDAKIYLIRKNLKLSETQFEAIPEREREEYLRRQLWEKEKFKAWQKEKGEEMRIKLASSARYKSYRRWMKNQGPGGITFDD
ncbi:PREDICTED: dnaJ homolog subfamily C member 25 homolog [Priapulus caudatus]|uniref:DnaJ homolog subfamily C member 25 homolog n=1 Tax=Priapulus caudatus TaxID=37621 RepID=A0ABM1DV63_PRICU|nr:PREDICTED: dnaJ homolog subfamily C member 25 homolog [Priapulus caudatus]